METDPRRQKLDLVWASVFPAVFAIWALSVLIFGAADDQAQLIALVMVCGLLLSIFTGSFLLMIGGHGRRLLMIGRVLVCLQLLCQAAAIVLAVLVTLSGD